MDLKMYEEKFYRLGQECDEKSQHKTTIAEIVGLF